MNDVIKNIRERRSIRSYDTARQISDADLSLILEAGMYAPTAQRACGILPPWDKELPERLTENKRYHGQIRQRMAPGSRSKPDFRATYNAPTVVFVSGA